MRLACLFVVANAVLAGCGGDEGTGLVLVLDAEGPLRRQTSGFQVLITSQREGEPMPIERDRFRLAPGELPHRVAVVPRPGDPLPATVQISFTTEGRACAFLDGPDECDGFDCSFELVAGRARSHRLVLRACPPDAGVVDAAPCIDGEACLQGCLVGVRDCETRECMVSGLAGAGTECRGSTGECDVPELCDGLSPACPIDQLVAAGMPCSAGFCDGLGSCTSECTPGAECRLESICERGVIDCTSGRPSCMSAGPAPSGTECRPSSGVCDTAEGCDGASTACPPDGFAGASTVCRPASDACDLAESCVGTGPACPPDTFAPAGTRCPDGACDGLGGCSSGCTPGAPCATGRPCEVGAIDCSTGTPQCVGAGFLGPGTVCRPSAGPCDAEEQCSGSSPDCPGDGFMSGSECRPSAGVCDVAERCDGASPNCPGNGFAGPGTACRMAAGSCDITESCTGSGAACPGDAFHGGGTVCRPSGGSCDVEERCSGSSPSCPGNGFRTGLCRGSAGPCDVEEHCSGGDEDCPGDDFQSGGVCRGSAGPCDQSESCDGSGPGCPSDRFRNGPECRGSAGACDPAENCDGSGPGCPGDARSTGECRAAAGPCDIAESCDGSDVNCPGDGFASAGTPCPDDGRVCTLDECGGTGPSDCRHYPDCTGPGSCGCAPWDFCGCDFDGCCLGCGCGGI